MSYMSDMFMFTDANPIFNLNAVNSSWFTINMYLSRYDLCK